MKNFDIDRAVELGEAIGTMQAAIWLCGRGEQDRAIESLRKCVEKLTTLRLARLARLRELGCDA